MFSFCIFSDCLGLETCVGCRWNESCSASPNYKSESYYLTKHDTYEDVLKDVSNYIRYYNNHRYTERLEGLSP
ncbi:IS3 family transposase, partial [Paenibacillus cookii]|uniref:IS3 family transposase n=1 Tax=Paenibacillus cookii TaxID=157839 RepID=UPI001BB3419E